ncbi:zf-C2HC5-domain-containing protein [Canariomyces notabilis]|uniref:Zf-C2HC5-domain-containing protein n=1 Tax=Canariomyces notabilis TaxID=2074819 RepID=A0AAN6TFC6_9PEZI|nr:zf-C2HC5-domain-containing protein [Canariomyces arenarius]
MSKQQLFQILPLPDEDLQQVLDYASTLSKAEAAAHFSNLLGDSPQVIDFISTFNSRRADPKHPPTTAPSSGQSSEIEGVTKHRRAAKKNKASLHTPPPRQVASFALAPGTVYNKKDQQEDYVSGRAGSSTHSNGTGSQNKPPPTVTKSATPPPPSSKPPPSAAGTLVSDLGLPKAKPKSTPVSRTSTPGPSFSARNNAPHNTAAAKVSITGGTPMHGSSTALADLDQAIRALEISTNPSLAANNNPAARRCNCVATRHPLLAAAPNCLQCGKVICVKEGLGPCTFCGTPLLTPAEVQGMIRELKAERGREKMAADREAHKRVDGSGGGGGRNYAAKPDPSLAEAMAMQHRDRLLAFQAQNAKRTVVRDEAADFDVSLTGGSMWATPEQRALALKKQQRLLREMEWNAKPEYEKRQQVVSIDLSGRKVLKKTVKVERPSTPDDDSDDAGGGEGSALAETDGNRRPGQGAFSRNPLLGNLVRPVYDPEGKGVELQGRKDRGPTWRKVQDDLDDNQDVILDGGIYGGKATTGDEPGCG